VTRLRVAEARGRIDLPAVEAAIGDLRGVQATGSTTRTSALRGHLRDDLASRQEFFTLALGS